MKNNIVICIGRQFGSGGKEIGELVAKKLGIPCYDKEIIYEMAKKSGVSKELLEDYDERPTNSFLYSLSLGSYSSHGNIISNTAGLPLTDKIFLIQRLETQQCLFAKLPLNAALFTNHCPEPVSSGFKILCSKFD